MRKRSAAQALRGCGLRAAQQPQARSGHRPTNIRCLQYGTVLAILSCAFLGLGQGSPLAGYSSPSDMVCKSGGSWSRPSGDVANSEAGVADCAAKCADYTYFGLECPQATTAHCNCANTLAGSSSELESECQSGHSHCSGPYKQGDYNMGGASRGSVYFVNPSPPPAQDGAPSDPNPACVPHIGLSGGTEEHPTTNGEWPQFMGLTLVNGSAADPEWYQPYMNHVLDEKYHGIEWPSGSGKFVNCNPASCDNPPECGIPVCRGMARSGAEYTRSYTTCQTACSNLPFTTISNSAPHLPDGPPNSEAWYQTVAGTREGYFQDLGTTPAYAQIYPKPVPSGESVSVEGYMMPTSKFCNPLQFLSTGKMSTFHTGFIGSGPGKVGLLFVKSTMCIKANCASGDDACVSNKCYVDKRGKCLWFNNNVFDTYQSKTTATQAEAAYAAFKAGQYTQCDSARTTSALQYLAVV